MFSRFNLFLIMMIGFIDQLGIGLVYPLFAVMLFDHNSLFVPGDTSEVVRGLLFGVLIALTPLAQFFSSPILGAISDKKGRKKVLQMGISTGVVGYLCAIIGVTTHSIELLLLYRLLVGISDGTASVAHAALADISTEANKSRHFSLLNMAFGAGFTLGPFVGGALSDSEIFSWGSFAAPFYFAGAMSFINLMLVSFKFPESRIISGDIRYNVFDGIYNLGRAFHWKGLRMLFAGGFFFFFGWTFFMEFMPIYLKENFQFTTTEIGNFYAYQGFWYSLSAGLLTLPLLNRYAPEKIVSKALVLSGIYLPSFLLIENPLHFGFWIPPMIYMAALIYPTCNAIVSNKTSSDKQGEVIGVFHSVSSFAIGISPLFAGSIVAAYPSTTAWGGSLFMLIGGFIYWVGTRTPKPSPSPIQS